MSTESTKLEYSTLSTPSLGLKQIESSYEELETIRRSNWEQITNIKKSTVHNESVQTEVNLKKHEHRLKELKRLDEEIPIKQSQVEQRAAELLDKEQADELLHEFSKFKADCEKILDEKNNLIKIFSKDLENKHSVYISSIQRFKTDIIQMIAMMRKQFIVLRDKMLGTIWNEKIGDEQDSKRKTAILESSDKPKGCIEGEFLRDRENLLKEYHTNILNLIKKLEKEEQQSGSDLSRLENEREVENEKEAFKEETKFINRIIVMEKFFNILKEQIEDFTYELKILLEVLEYRVEIREEKIKENKEKLKEYNTHKNRMKLKISKSQKQYKMIDDKLRSENMALKIDFIKTTESFDDLKKKFKHFKSYDEEQFMKIYNMNFIESKELAKKVLYADRTIKSQQLGVDFPPNDTTEGFTLDELQKDDHLEDERAILVKAVKTKVENENLIKQNILAKIPIERVKEVFMLIIQEAEFLIDMQTIDKYGHCSMEEKLPYYIESLCKALQIKNEQELNHLLDLFDKKSQNEEDKSDNYSNHNNASMSEASEGKKDSKINIDPDKVLDYLKEFYEERKKISKNEGTI